MDHQEPQFLEVGQNRRRRIAFRFADVGDRDSPALLWVPGFLSDMESTKALALADWARAQAVPMLRFDYSGHGLWNGDLLEPSMGGWIALLLVRQLQREERLERLAGLVLIAPAWDMTERLMWHRMTPEVKETLERDGVYYEPSLYGDPYPITKNLIEEGRSHLIGDGLLRLDRPVRILQGMCDPDVPWGHALDLVDLLCCEDVELTLIKDGDHRQSRPQDLRRLEATVAALVDRIAR